MWNYDTQPVINTYCGDINIHEKNSVEINKFQVYETCLRTHNILHTIIILLAVPVAM